MASQLFKTKSPERLIAEAAAPERQMKRSLSAFDLTCLGIGAIIGSGIFALTGTAAAGERKNSSANDRANANACEIERAQRAFHLPLRRGRFGNEVVGALGSEKLRGHSARSCHHRLLQVNPRFSMRSC